MKENSEKVDMYDFPVHDYTQEQNGSPYSISTFDSANGLSRKIVVIQKFCYHGNLTSHFSFLSRWLKGLKPRHLGFMQLKTLCGGSINPLSSDIRIYILHTDLYTFP